MSGPEKNLRYEHGHDDGDEGGAAEVAHDATGASPTGGLHGVDDHQDRDRACSSAPVAQASDCPRTRHSALGGERGGR